MVSGDTAGVSHGVVICLPSASVEILCQFGEEHDEDNYIQASTKALPSDLLSSLSPISRVELIDLDCIWDGDSQQQYEFALSGCDAGGLPAVKIKFYFQEELEPFLWRNYLNDQVVFIRTAFRGAPLTHLKISVMDAVSIEPAMVAPVEHKEWSNVLKTFPALESLHLRGMTPLGSSQA